MKNSERMKLARSDQRQFDIKNWTIEELLAELKSFGVLAWEANEELDKRGYLS